MGMHGIPHSHANVSQSELRSLLLTHPEVGHTTVSQDHDEFGLVGPPLLLPSSVQVLDRGEKRLRTQPSVKDRVYEQKVVGITVLPL